MSTKSHHLRVLLQDGGQMLGVPIASLIASVAGVVDHGMGENEDIRIGIFRGDGSQSLFQPFPGSPTVHHIAVIGLRLQQQKMCAVDGCVPNTHGNIRFGGVQLKILFAHEIKEIVGVDVVSPVIVISGGEQQLVCDACLSNQPGKFFYLLGGAVMGNITGDHYGVQTVGIQLVGLCLQLLNGGQELCAIFFIFADMYIRDRTEGYDDILLIELGWIVGRLCFGRLGGFFRLGRQGLLGAGGAFRLGRQGLRGGGRLLREKVAGSKQACDQKQANDG